MMELIRNGRAPTLSGSTEGVVKRDGSISSLMALGSSLLGRNQVLPHVPSLVREVQIEATFPDGTKLLTIHDPIGREDGDLALALEGSFLPVPDLGVFSADGEKEKEEEGMCPGQILVSSSLGEIEINPKSAEEEGGEMHLIEIPVTNTGDRPIQVGSHYPFIETNPALLFDRRLSLGRRLNVPSGSSVRFEPGETKTVTLVSLGGKKNVVCGNGLTGGIASSDRWEEIEKRMDGRFGNAPLETTVEGKPFTLSRTAYSDAYGPTAGDRILLGDTSLLLRIEKDYTTYGEECKFGGGKSLREGMGQMTSVSADLALDCVITNAILVDARVGVVKCDIGIKGNKIHK